MPEELASANVNRSYSLAATSIAIFTFMLFFLYPRFKGGEVNPILFQATLAVMGVATFSLVFASLSYYRACADPGEVARTAAWSRQGNRYWLLGYTLLFLAPSLILLAIGLLGVGLVWFALWLVYLISVLRFFPGILARER